MTSPAPRRTRIREMTRQAVQAEISDSAMRLFMEQGFDQTTIEQVGAAVGMSGRSVSRYFATKEDMVVGSMTKLGGEIAEALRSRPATESAWEALRRALDPQLMALEHDGGVALARATLLSTTPALHAAQMQKHASWAELLIPEIEDRLPGRGADGHVWANAIVGAVLACLQAAVDEWTRSGGKRSLGPLLDVAIAAVRG